MLFARRVSLPAAVCLALGFVLTTTIVTGVEASEDRRSVIVQAEVFSRTVLRVSAEDLHFEIADPAVAATASLEFWAGARTKSGGEVLLLVEPVHGAWNASSGAGAVELGLAAAEGSGSESVSPAGPTIVRRWRQSGSRRGTLPFVFRASKPGTYRVALRVVLTAP